MTAAHCPVAELLSRYQPQGVVEAADVARTRLLVERTDDPWSRSNLLHMTASALVVHPPTRRVLLRWHERVKSWLHVGGHGEPGETDPMAVAMREAHEETGLADLEPLPDAGVVHVAVVPVPADGDDPAHEHADLRFVLTTAQPDAAVAERPEAPLRWLSVPDARALTADDNVAETLSRVDELL
ncbi:MAG: NUDIX domain-containing protein [Streptosporangiales bacterium]|nr:NUDIX domain-containing protein [Streptosporangiales bacterium]MBO0889267.1 NUDIX domain-containing protein [Acidothermales bacterium]